MKPAVVKLLAIIIFMVGVATLIGNAAGIDVLGALGDTIARYF